MLSAEAELTETPPKIWFVDAVTIAWVIVACCGEGDIDRLVSFEIFSIFDINRNGTECGVDVGVG